VRRPLATAPLASIGARRSQSSLRGDGDLPGMESQFLLVRFDGA
jgi:hypothetical protein